MARGKRTTGKRKEGASMMPLEELPTMAPAHAIKLK